MHRCKVCGKDFKSHNPNPQFCSRSCKSISQTADIDFDLAVQRYESGMSQLEVGKTFGVTQKAIKNLFQRKGYKSRIAGNHDQKGKNNFTWKGDKASYDGFHARVIRERGRPKQCEVCGTTSAKWYDWANLTGDYNDPADYKRMCRSCHHKYDRKILNIRHMKEKIDALNLR